MKQPNVKNEANKRYPSEKLQRFHRGIANSQKKAFKSGAAHMFELLEESLWDWKDIREDQPGHEQLCIVFDPDLEPNTEYCVAFAFYYADSMGFYMTDTGGNVVRFDGVTDWMPLPAPPESRIEHFLNR